MIDGVDRRVWLGGLVLTGIRRGQSFALGSRPGWYVYVTLWRVRVGVVRSAYRVVWTVEWCVRRRFA